MNPKFVPTKHPVLMIPTAAQAAAMGEQRWSELLMRREKMILQEQDDPLQFGWEPPEWQLADALLGLPMVDPAWAARVRKALGFPETIKILLIMGGNRGAKTDYAVKRMQQQMNLKGRQRAWVFHSTSAQSIEVHHERFWDYLPPAYRHNVRAEVEYISYKQKTGFSDMKFVLPNGSETTFKHYSMEKDDAIQGGEIDMFLGDELIPIDWVDELGIRIATRRGWGVVAFTPKEGYSSTVRGFQNGAETVLESTAFLIPKDGQPPALPQALGFGSEGEMLRAHADERWSVPSRFTFVTGRDGVERLVEVQPEIPAGRTFERVPRVMKCVDPTRAILFFPSSDNPYGCPSNVYALMGGAGAPKERVQESFYGLAKRKISVSFPKFDVRVHRIAAKDVPTEGSRYMLADPHGRRNWFMLWVLFTKVAAYVYREWPGPYDIPGVGHPGPWALPDGHKLDGRAGPAQRPFGFGLARLIREIARLEGWVAKDGHFEENGAKERMVQRLIDSRAASSPRVEHDRPVTLQTDLEELGIHFDLTPGDSIDDGIQAITNRLDYDADRPLAFDNQPKLFISDACPNTIFALETWTGEDGQEGACKEPIDLLRYLFLADCGYVSDDFWQTTGGGHY